jgi:ABC-type Fe3+/spermidine/putrescine transport system ATPase subunit
MVFQDYALFPHMTVAENVAFGLRERRWTRAAVGTRVKELMDLVKLPGAEGRYPRELSGGQQQRIALARALAFNPHVLLMDEPFGALDLKLRDAMQGELVQIQRNLKITTIFVTHDQDEAMAMSHRIAVMGNGHIQQLGTPEEIYNYPANVFVADFIGKINLISAKVVELKEDRVFLRANGSIFVALPASWAVPGCPAKIAIRPEALSLRRFSATPADTETNAVEGVVSSKRFAGSAHFLEVSTELFGRLVAKVPIEELHAIEEARVSVSWSYKKAVLLKE